MRVATFYDLPGIPFTSTTTMGSNCLSTSSPSGQGLQQTIDRLVSGANSADENHLITIPGDAICSEAITLKPKKKSNVTDVRTGIGWIVVKPSVAASQLPPPGVRTDRKYIDAGVIPHIQVDGGTVVGSVDYAAGYRFENIDVRHNPQGDPNSHSRYDSTIFLSPTQQSGERESTKFPYRVIFDRVFAGGQWNNSMNVASAVRFNGGQLGFINSLAHNCNPIPDSDTGCVTVADDKGPFLFDNSDMEGGSETFFGEPGGAATLANGVGADVYPQDITITRNHIHKPWSYYSRHASFPTQTVIPVSSQSISPSGLQLVLASPSDVGSTLNAVSTVNLRGATGQWTFLNQPWAATRIDKLNILLPVQVPSYATYGSTLQLSANVADATSTTATFAKVSGPGSVTTGGLYSASSSGAGGEVAIISATTTATPAATAYLAVQLGNSYQTLLLDSSTGRILHPTETFQYTVKDGRAVTWSVVSGGGSIDADGTYHAPSSISVRGPAVIRAVDQANSATMAFGTAILEPTPTFAPIRYTENSSFVSPSDAYGNKWTGDPNNGSVCTGGSQQSYSFTIFGVDSPELFQGRRYQGPFSCVFSVPNGTYTVKLGFVNVYGESVGSRVVHIAINGTTVTSPDLDTWVAAGQQLYQAFYRSYTGTVTNGTLTVAFSGTGTSGEALLNNIEILQGTGDHPKVYVKAASPTSTITGQFWEITYGRDFQEKNLLELKKGKRVKIVGNLLERNWAAARNTSAAQGGAAFVLTVRSGLARYNGFTSLATAQAKSQSNAEVSDILIDKNMIRDTNGLLTNAGADDNALTGNSGRMVLTNNLIQLDPSLNETLTYGSVGIGINQGYEGFRMTHNTVLMKGAAIDGTFPQFASIHGPAGDTTINNNILPFQYEGIGGDYQPYYGYAGWANRPLCLNGDWPCTGSQTRGPLQAGGDSQGRKSLLEKNLFYAYGRSSGWTANRDKWGSAYFGDNNTINAQYWLDQGTIASAGSLANAIGFTAALATPPNYTLSTSSPYKAGAAVVGVATTNLTTSGPASDGGPVGVQDYDALDVAMGTVQGTTATSNAATTATITFTAPDAIGCPIDLSTTAAFTSFSRISDAGGQRTRSISLAGLTASTTYYARVDCQVQQPIVSFTTSGAGGGGNSTTLNLALPSCVITATVQYGATAALGQQTSATTCSGSGCSVVVPVLTPGALLYYRATYRDSYGNVIRIDPVQSVQQ